VLGDADSGELIALRRLQFIQKTTTKLSFEIPNDPVGSQRTVWLYLCSDSYVGLDQQYEVAFTVQEGDPIEEGDYEEEVGEEGTPLPEDGTGEETTQAEGLDEEEEGFW